MLIDGKDMGGDPACWLNRVCQTCGRFVDDEFAVTCPNCGAPRYDDDPGSTAGTSPAESPSTRPPG